VARTGLLQRDSAEPHPFPEPPDASFQLRNPLLDLDSAPLQAREKLRVGSLADLRTIATSACIRGSSLGGKSPGGGLLADQPSRMIVSMARSAFSEIAMTPYGFAVSIMARFLDLAEPALDLRVPLVRAPLPRPVHLLLGLDLAQFQVIGRAEPERVVDEQVEVVEAPVDPVKAPIMVFELAANALQFRAHLAQLHQNEVFWLAGDLGCLLSAKLTWRPDQRFLSRSAITSTTSSATALGIASTLR
jgi:hypothetical protein